MSHSLRHLGGDRWQCVIFLGRDENGAQRRKSRTFRARSKREATGKGHQVEAELRAELDRTDLTLAEAVDIWWADWTGLGRSPSTVESYRIILDRHVLASPLAAKPVRDITTGDVQRWYTSLRQQPTETRKGRKPKPLSPARVRRIHAVLTQVFDQCINDRELTVNPAAGARKPEANAKRRQFVAPEVVAQILAAATEAHPVRGRALAFAARSGLRRGELAALRWSKVAGDERMVIVDQAVVEVAGKFIPKREARWPTKGQQWPDGRFLVLKDTKAHNVEPILLDDNDAALLAQQAEWQTQEAEKAGCRLPADPFLFAVRPPFDRPIQPDVLTGWHAEACEAAGMEGVRLHDLRHHHASMLLKLGATLEEVRQRLRHRNLQTTMGYLEADPGRQRELLARLPRLEIGG